jgi:hypothetical protein
MRGLLADAGGSATTGVLASVEADVSARGVPAEGASRPAIRRRTRLLGGIAAWNACA